MIFLPGNQFPNRFQSCGARRGLKRIMLREDYVEDKLIFKLRKHTGVVLLI